MPSVDPAELEGKANLLTDMQLGAVTVKKNEKLGASRPAHCSLYLLCPQERERKKPHSSFFFLYTATVSRSHLFFSKWEIILEIDSAPWTTHGIPAPQFYY